MEQGTFVAYQTVRAWVMTRNKKRMPKFTDLLPKSDGWDQTVSQMKATMRQLAHQYGRKRMRVSTHGE